MSYDLDSDEPPIEIKNCKLKKKFDHPTEDGPRDPRFDPRVSGSSDPRHFVRNYSFLDEVRQNEFKELQRALKFEQNPEKRAKIQMAIGRYRNKAIDLKNKAATPTVNRRNKRDKKSKLVEQFKDLKATGKLNKYLERKRKKFIKRDERSLA